MSKLHKDVCGYEDLHKHSDFSLLDGFAQVEEYAWRCPQINQKYLCISDHGMMAVIPRQIRACEAMGLTPIFACELYVNNKHLPKDRLTDLSDDEKKEVRKSYHLLAIAYTNEGYQNLVRLTSWAFLNGFYYKPRVNHEQLLKHKEGIIFTSCCYNGEIGQAFERGGPEAAEAMLVKYMGFFGKNFYLEMMLLDFSKQKPYDAWLVKMQLKYGIPIIVTNDCHFCNPEDNKYQRYMLMIQTGRTMREVMASQSSEGEDGVEAFEMFDPNLYLKSEPQLNAKWEERVKPTAQYPNGFSYSDIIPLEMFQQAKRNTVEICKRVKVRLDRSVKLPQIPEADSRFREAVMKGFKWRSLPGSNKYISRLKQEFDLITRKGFSSYFMIQQEIIQEARRVCPELIGWGNGDEAVGPGRGCLSPDVPVVLGDGTMKKISDIVPGEFVWTVDGSKQIVEKVLSYPVKEDLLRICCFYGDASGVTLTKDHKVLVEKLRRPVGYDDWSDSTKSARKTCLHPENNLQWLRADQIEVGDWVFVPIPKTEIKIPSRIDLGSEPCENLVVESDCVHQDWMNPLTGTLRKRKTCARYMDCDEDFVKILGLFTGDGWIRNNDHTHIGLCFHSENNVAGLALVRRFCDRYHLDYKVTRSSSKKLIQIHVRHKALCLCFKRLFNLYQSSSQTKHVPHMVFGLPNVLKEAFLEGYRMSDGHVGGNKITYTTTSEYLASQIRFLFWQIGVPASLGRCKRFDRRSGKESFGFSINTPPECPMKVYNYATFDDGVLLKVRDVSVVKDVHKVYDLTVANNHNYLTDSFLVHNSAVGSLVCYCLGITDVDPVRHGLLFDRFLSESRGGRNLKTRFSDIPLPEAA